ncbi:MAG TPA: hypothetical protein VFY40_16910 [Blastocatellia bacterium]|nr:hypothetical protein [Blastocatellia bacterium]
MIPDQMRKAEIAMMKVGIRAMQVGAFVSKPIIAPTKSGRVKGCLAADDYLW